MGSDDAPGSGRPDEEPTINEAGTPGFAVDGTDSFAVPGPADGLPPELDVDDDGLAAVGRRRIAVTLAAALLLLVAVIALGSLGGDDDRLAGDDAVHEGSSVPTTEASATDGSPIVRPPDDADTLARLEAGATLSTGTGATAYDEYTTDTYASDPYTTSDTLDDGTFDDTTSNDTYVGRYVPSITRPRTYPTVPRRTIPTTPTRTRTTSAPASVTTTTEAPETTTEETTTTTSTTTTEAPTTTTTLAPTPVAPTWQPVTALPTCTSPIGLWAGSSSLFAQAGGELLRSTDGGTAWAVTGLTADVRDVAEPPGAPAGTFWVGAATGVLDHGGLEVGSLDDVRSIAAHVSGQTKSLLAIAGSTLQRGDGTSWLAVDDPDLAAVEPRAVQFLPSGDALLGTSDGVFRSIDGGRSWQLAPSSDNLAVSGPPAVGIGRIAWLVGDGVITSSDSGATWTHTPTNPSVAGLAMLSDDRLIAVADAKLQALGGAAWSPFTPAPSVSVSGVVHSTSAKATFVAGSQCADSVLRLPDSPAT